MTAAAAGGVLLRRAVPAGGSGRSEGRGRGDRTRPPRRASIQHVGLVARLIGQPDGSGRVAGQVNVGPAEIARLGADEQDPAPSDENCGVAFKSSWRLKRDFLPRRDFANDQFSRTQQRIDQLLRGLALLWVVAAIEGLIGGGPFLARAARKYTTWVLARSKAALSPPRSTIGCAPSLPTRTSRVTIDAPNPVSCELAAVRRDPWDCGHPWSARWW